MTIRTGATYGMFYGALVGVVGIGLLSVISAMDWVIAGNDDLDELYFIARWVVVIGIAPAVVFSTVVCGLVGAIITKRHLEGKARWIFAAVVAALPLLTVILNNLNRQELITSVHAWLVIAIFSIGLAPIGYVAGSLFQRSVSRFSSS